MLISVYANASASSGEGHVVRCEQLLSEFSGAKVTWYYKTLTPRVKDLLSARGYELRHLNISLRSASDALKRELAGKNYNFFLVDDYELDMNNRLTDSAIVAFDDLANRFINADILIDANPLRQKIDYAQLVSDSCSCLIGADFLILEKQLFIKGHKLENRGHLFLGATDPLKLTFPFLKTLLAIAPEWDWEVVVTSKTPDLERIRAYASQKSNVFFNYEPNSLAEGLVKAEVAIGAPGTTTWQRMAADCRVALVATNKNQIEILESLEEKGFIKYLGYGFDQINVEFLLRSFFELKKASKMPELDTDGALRIKNHIESFLA